MDMSSIKVSNINKMRFELTFDGTYDWRDDRRNS